MVKKSAKYAHKIYWYNGVGHQSWLLYKPKHVNPCDRTSRLLVLSHGFTCFGLYAYYFSITTFMITSLSKVIWEEGRVAAKVCHGAV